MNEINKRFRIYTMDVLKSINSLDFDSAVAFEFDSLFSLSYDNGVKVASEPLEGGGHSSDTIQTRPFILELVGCNSTGSSKQLNIAQSLLNKLEEYRVNKTLLLIVKNQKQSIFRDYKSFILINYRQDTSPDKTFLQCYMTFQEVRITKVEYGEMSRDKVTNKNNSDVEDGGSVDPKQSNKNIED